MCRRSPAPFTFYPSPFPQFPSPTPLPFSPALLQSVSPLPLLPSSQVEEKKSCAFLGGTMQDPFATVPLGFSHTRVSCCAPAPSLQSGLLALQLGLRSCILSSNPALSCAFVSASSLERCLHSAFAKVVSDMFRRGSGWLQVDSVVEVTTLPPCVRMREAPWQASS